MVLLETLATAAATAIIRELLAKLFSKKFLDLFKKWNPNTELLPKLKIALLSVIAVVNYAEEHQITNLAVNEWLDEIKNAVYDAEDILDDIAIKALQSNSQENQDGSTFTKTIETEVKKITDRLESIAQKIDVLGLRDGLAGKPSLRFLSTSLVDESEIFGRENDKNVILGFLSPTFPNANPNQVAAVNGPLPEADVNRNLANKISVVAIVGMPGVGKTALAQLLFNDQNVKTTFSPRVWVHVSEEFDILKITKTIYHSVDIRDGDVGDFHSAVGDFHSADLNLLQIRLQLKLKEKKFLLVLDDIWNENVVEWDVLQRPFKAADSGSRIIVTTRSRNVASVMRATHIHQLPHLSHRDCWSIFAKHAFRFGVDPDEYPEMKEIGKKIVKKCSGLPLAAKTLGALLYAKEKIDEWIGVLNSEIWDLPSDKSSILPALRLSYHYLPSHLKCCFAYCSIFPKGYKFQKENLVMLWMAEGLLPRPQSKNQKGDIGHNYFHELLSRSFFQQPMDEGKTYFTMHDLICDLAQSVAGDFCFMSENVILHEVPKRVRYYSFKPGKFDDAEKFDSFLGANHLRTFLSLESKSSTEALYLSPSTFENLLQAFSRLRVLSIARYKITEVPKSVRNLKSIRYLDLSRTDIKKLPKSVCSLYNLETLLLSECRCLTKLPEELQKLINLQHLDVSKTKLAKMPLQFGRLKKLRLLTAFVVGDTGSSIKELKDLCDLRGALSILNLENVHGTDARDAKLKDKDLSELVFNWQRITHHAQREMISSHAQNVLGDLQPHHKKLKKLTIENYGGKILPNWLGDVSFSEMVYLHLIGCENCSSLPPLGQLCSLKELHVSGMNGIIRVDSRFCRSAPSSIEPFRCLEILKFKNMRNWEVWSSFTDEERLPCLKFLHLSECPSLKGNLPKHLPSLEKLHIHRCRKLTLGFLSEDAEHRYRMLKQLEVRSSESPTPFPLGYFTNLEDLQIKNFSFLNSLEITLDNLRFLKNLSIQDCYNLQFSPEISLPTPNLVLLEVSNCTSLGSMPKHMCNLSSLQTLKISRCPGLQSFPEGGLPANLKSLSITKCINLSPQVSWGLDKMTSLISFEVEGQCSGLESFPAQLLSSTKLTSLCINGPKDLKSLTGLPNLISLETLDIHSCNKLICISDDEKLPLSLSTLNISECPHVIERCKPGGADWNKISHIPNRNIK